MQQLFLYGPLAPVFSSLILCCASAKIEKYGDLATPYRKAELKNVHLSDSCFSEKRNGDSVANFEYMHLLDSIEPGKEEYDIYYRYFLCTGPEGEVDYCHDAAIINLIDGKLNREKTVYYRSHNEIPHHFLKPLILIDSGQHLAKITGFNRDGDATILDLSFVGPPSHTVDSIRAEKRRILELVK